MAQPVRIENHNLRFLDEHLPDSRSYTFAIIVSRCRNEWIWVRHCERDAWELPAGHVEPGETVESAAVRELIEETGAIEFQMDPVVSYEGFYQGRKVFGKIFYADIKELGPLPAHEICEVCLLQEIPSKLTYADIQPSFFNYVLDWLNQRPFQPVN